MINKIYQIECEHGCSVDYCDATNPTKADAIEHFKSVGWIFKGGKHYCSEQCSIKREEIT